MDPKTLGDVLGAQGTAIDELKTALAAMAQAPPNDPNASDTKQLTMADLAQMATDGKVIDADGKPVSNIMAEFNAMNPIANVAGQLDRAVAGIPVGSALIGGFGGILTAEIIDGFVPPTGDDGKSNPVNGLVKVGAAWGTMAFLQPHIGRTGAIVMAASLVYTVARDFIPLDEWIQKIVSKIKGAQQANRFSKRGGGGAAAALTQSRAMAQTTAGQGGDGVDRFAGIYR